MALDNLHYLYNKIVNFSFISVEDYVLCMTSADVIKLPSHTEL